MRDQGQGHIRQRGPQRWELKFDLGRDPISGKRETRYHSFRGTKRERKRKPMGLGLKRQSLKRAAEISRCQISPSGRSGSIESSFSKRE